MTSPHTELLVFPRSALSTTRPRLTWVQTTLLTPVFYCPRQSTVAFACDNFSTAPTLSPTGIPLTTRAVRRGKLSNVSVRIAPSIQSPLGMDTESTLHRGINKHIHFSRFKICRFSRRSLFHPAYYQYTTRGALEGERICWRRIMVSIHFLKVQSLVCCRYTNPL